MAARPKSGITADMDVNLDFLTKEEKEAFLSKKMDMIRQKNKALTERHKLIEADRKKAEEAGQAVKPAIDSQSLPAEGAPRPRGRGRGQRDREPNRPARERPKSSGDFRDSSNYEPIVDTTDLANYKSKGRGGSHDRDAPVNTPKNRRKPPPNKEEGNHSGPRHSNNRRHDDGPPPDPSFNPLADRRRSDRKEEPSDHKRHPRNYGGGADLSRVKQSMKHMREKEKERPPSNKPLEMVMTGKERRNHEEWKAERERYDKERIQRQMNDAGSWKRAWDADKIPQEYDDQYSSSRQEPAKRPAGRIGSGRFDRGERDDRPRSAVIGKGGLQPDHSQPQPSSQRQHHHQDQQQATMSPHQPQLGDSNNRAPKGRGRGRGKGRGRGNAPGGEKSPRPRTWSGGDDRFVECQKELLVVKFDNTAGDNSVEVEYDDGEFPASPPTTPKSSTSSTTTPGRGPTGRTPNQATKQQQSRGGKQQKKAPRHKARPQSGSGQDQHQIISTEDDWDAASPGSQQVTLDHGSLAAIGYPDESRVRTSSHSQSFGDSEEWEDCTESSGMQEEDDYAVHAGLSGLSDPRDDNPAGNDLHLECRLNPEAPEFLPTSPDFMKTPPGHVKVLNWAADGSPTSPLSQGSATSPHSLRPNPMSSPRPLPNTTQSPGSSPGSSASVRAARRKEESDLMPEGDQPHPPPFLLGMEEKTSSPPVDEQHLQTKRAQKQVQKEETPKPDDDDDDKFEDSVDDVQTQEEDGDLQTQEEVGDVQTQEKDGDVQTQEEDGDVQTQEEVGDVQTQEEDVSGEEKIKELPQATDTPGEAASNHLEDIPSEPNSSPSKTVAANLAEELAEASSQGPTDALLEPATDLASELAQAAQAIDISKDKDDPAENSLEVDDKIVDKDKSDKVVQDHKEALESLDATDAVGSTSTVEPLSPTHKEDKKSLLQELEEANGQEESSVASGEDSASQEITSTDSVQASSEDAGSKSSPTEVESATPTADISASS